MAVLIVTLASGRSIVIDSSACPTAADASHQISEELNVANGCVKLVTSSGCELNNEDLIDAMCLAEVTAVILLDKLLEARIAEAASVNHFVELFTSEKLSLEHNHLTALPDSFAQLC